MIAAAVIRAITAPSWVFGGAFIDFDFARNRYYAGGKTLTLAQAVTETRSTPGSVDSVAGIVSQIAALTPRRSDKGLLSEQTRKNVLAWCRDLSNTVAWTPTNTTVTADATGADGVAPTTKQVVVLDTPGTTTWTVPNDFESGRNYIECIGCGGSSSPGDINNGAGATGGSGAYAAASNIALTPGSTVAIQIGAGGAEVATFLKDNASVTRVSAEQGHNATLRSRGLWGLASNSIGDIKYNGGLGQNSAAVTGNRAGGGGAAAGSPRGSGGGGASTGTSLLGGGGGGGVNLTAGTAGTTGVGGTGGKGAGASATAGGTSSVAAGNGAATTGAGGGGGASSTGLNGGNGSADEIGVGGGGGGGGIQGGNGGNAGGYGGSGGSGGSTSTTAGSAGTSGTGAIRISYGGGVSRLVATGANATVFQQTATSDVRQNFVTAYIKRLVGTGTISLSMDGGSTWTDVTSQVPNDGAFHRVTGPTASVQNPNVGVQLATSGDSIALDFLQCEQSIDLPTDVVPANYPSAPILTAAGAVTRNVDNVRSTLASIGLNVPLGAIHLTAIVVFTMTETVFGGTELDFATATDSAIDALTNNFSAAGAFGTTIANTGGGSVGVDPAGVSTSVGDHVFVFTGNQAGRLAATAVDGSAATSYTSVGLDTDWPAAQLTKMKHGGIVRVAEQQLNGYVKRVIVIPQAVTAAQVSALSAMGSQL